MITQQPSLKVLLGKIIVDGLISRDRINSTNRSNRKTVNVLPVEIADVCLQSQSKNKHTLILQIFVCD